ncbi:MAG: hypothetical protein Ta2F_17800 [Termitinemataceae bacterium]|nr:MAG: hypothetical protein Ta2F_17800 [Termitinemataceae bacterium]
MGGREAVFYVGRVTKSGFEKEDFVNALLDPKPFTDNNNYVWNIVATNELEYDGIKYYYGKLNKANPNSTVKIMTNDYREEIEKDEPDMILCTSEFIYIPIYSGIAFQSIPNSIEQKKFKDVFQNIIETTLGGFFVECKINLIDDLVTFLKRLKQFDSISTIKVSVTPPNPMFGRFWESLRDYLQERNADKVLIKEISKQGKLISKLIELIEVLLRNEEKEIIEYLKLNKISLADAGILMSMDGYGNGRIDGKVGGEKLFIKTHERVLHFTVQKDINNEDVFIKANNIFKRINNERHMEH